MKNVFFLLVWLRVLKVEVEFLEIFCPKVKQILRIFDCKCLDLLIELAAVSVWVERNRHFVVERGVLRFSDLQILTTFKLIHIPIRDLCVTALIEL